MHCALCRPEQEWEGANEVMEPSVRGEVCFLVPSLLKQRSLNSMFRMQ